MNIAHHLDEATLMRFGSGTLDEAFNVVVATHLAMCAQCRAALDLVTETGGALLDAEAPTPLASSSLELMLARLDEAGTPIARPPEGQPIAQSISDSEGSAPLSLRPYVGTHWERAQWRRIAPGVAKCTLRTHARDAGSLFLLRVNPGLTMLEHGHGGDEMTLILEGAYRDAYGEFKAGDVADLDEHDEHLPTVVSDVACVCLVATQRPARFKGVVGRLLQPLLGI